jgi:serine protease inhibitor
MKGDGKDLADAHNDFGLHLFDNLVQEQPGNNVLISPTSIGLALAVVYNGAAGETERQMAATLALKGMTLEEINQEAARLMAELQNVPEGVQLALANSLWLRHTASLHPAFVERAQAAYRAELRNVDFGRAAAVAAQINEWTAGQTRQKIRNLVSEQALDPATLFILVNALYFKGAWTTPFDPTRTRPALFRTATGERQEAPRMGRSGEFDYLETADFQAASLPYSNGRFRMLVALPRAGVSPENLPRLLQAHGWPNRLRLKKSDGFLALPRFKIEYGAELSSHLATLGMGAAFSRNADFSAMTGEQVWIQMVRHKTFLEVNEEGSEAAAATAVTIVAAAMFSDRFEMIVDRPFFCAIQDNSSGALLFVGQICRL